MTKLEFSLNLPTQPDQLMKLSEYYENISNYLPDQLKSVKIIEKNDLITSNFWNRLKIRIKSYSTLTIDKKIL